MDNKIKVNSVTEINLPIESFNYDAPKQMLREMLESVEPSAVLGFKEFMELPRPDCYIARIQAENLLKEN